MSREIKFRAWSYETGNPIYTQHMYYSSDQTLRIFFENVEREFCSVEVMQYTGLKDKNGKEIYKGDIVRLFNEPSRLVIVDEYYFTNITLNGVDKEEQEILGNIFENPELLEK